MHIRNNKSGFTIIEIVGGVALLAIIVVAVIFGVKAHNKSAASTATPTPGATVSPLATASPALSPTVSPENYLTIKELGIKIPLTSSIYDLEYKYVAASGSNPIYLNFSTASISSIPAGNTTCNTDRRPLGTYTVWNSAQPAKQGTLIATVKGDYIYYLHAQSTCGNTLMTPLYDAVAAAIAE
jgi:hypothetical protein